MPWNADNQEINGVIDANLKPSPPNPPGINTAETVKNLFLAFWEVVSGQVSTAIDFVDETNSSVFIQQSIAQAQAIRDAAALASQSVSTNTGLTLAALARAETAAQRAELGLVYKGTYNVTTNTPALTATPNAAWPDGSYLDITPNSGALTFAGENFTVGKQVNPGDRLKKLGNQWSHVKATDLALQQTAELQKLITANTSDQVLFPFMDAKSRLLMGFTLAGEWFAHRFKPASIPRSALASLQIALNDLGTEVTDKMWQVLDPNTGYIMAILDKKNRILIGIRTDGSVFIPRLLFTIPDGSIGQNKLDAATAAKLDAGGTVNVNDRVFVEPDNLIHGKFTDIGFKTSYYGAQFLQLVRQKTPVISGINNSGTALEFRKSSGLTFRGNKYIDTYAPSAVLELTFKGFTAVAPSMSGRVAGDYFKIGTIPGATLTINGEIYNSGDLAVYDAVTSNFVKKAAPAPSGTSLIGHFWIVTSAGTFDKIAYQPGDIIYMSARQAAGGPFYRHFNKQAAGEFFFADSFTPASFAAPAQLANGLVYIAAAAGTFDSKVFAKNDYLVRYNNAWHIMNCDPVVTIAPNAFFNFRCNLADDYEIRRADLSGISASLTAKGITSFQQKQSTDSIIMYGDSMVGMLSLLAGLLPTRTVVSKSYGGGTSDDVKSMVEWEVLNNGDPGKGFLQIQYHGQNNDSDPARTKDMVDKILNLRAARDNRFLLLSVLGNRYQTWNGTRLVADLQEAAFNNVAGNVILDIENHYLNKYPGNCLIVRKEFLAAAATITDPDLQYPGMSIAQVAATYGIPPLSYWLDYTTLPYPAAQWNFKGYYNSQSVAPSDGVDKDYYICTTGGINSILGSFWLNVAGVWQQITWDRVHTNPVAGKTVFANAIKNWLTTNKL